MMNEGWLFATPEPLYGYTRLHQIYTHANSSYTGRVTVPVLWDKKHQTIVSNESADIIRMFNREFNDITETTKTITRKNKNWPLMNGMLIYT